MGIDYDAKMMVGLWYEDLPLENVTNKEGSQVDFDEVEFWEWADEYGMCGASPYYDSEIECQVWGFEVNDTVNVSELGKFVDEVNDKAKKFVEIFGVDPKLMAIQNIW